MRRLLSLLIFFFFIQFSFAQKIDRKLQKQVEPLFAGFKGIAGVHILNVKTGSTVSVNADSIFPTASMIKIPILIGVMDKMRKGELNYHQELMYRDSLLYPGVDILGSFRDSAKIELSKLIMLMLTTSDNTASLWLQSLAGTGTRINQLLDSMGFQYTRVNSRTPGREANRDIYGWGQTTPREMVLLMEKIFRGQALDQTSSNRMVRLLGRNYWDEEAISEIPSSVFIASKNGAVDESRSETLLVMAPSSPYIFSIITKNQADQSWEPGNEGWVLSRKLSALLWKYYSK